MGCEYCGTAGLLVRVGPVQVMAPRFWHVSPSDGGHLVVAPHRHVPSRMSMNSEELYASVEATRIAAKLLQGCFGADWFNFQENGNWSVHDGQKRHAHTHIYGRSRGATAQPFGEALCFPRRADLDDWRVDQPTRTDLGELEAHSKRAVLDTEISEILRKMQAVSTVFRGALPEGE